MAIKPFDQLSPSYRSRLEGFARTHGVTARQVHADPGLRALARSHKPSARAEAQIRREADQTGQVAVLAGPPSDRPRESQVYMTLDEAQRAGTPGYSVIVPIRIAGQWAYQLYYQPLSQRRAA